MVLWKHACYCLSGQWALFGPSDFSLLLCQLIKQLVLTQALCSPSPTPLSYVAREGCLHSRLFLAPSCLRRFVGENRRRLSRETHQAETREEEMAVFVAYLSSPFSLFFVRQVCRTGVILSRHVGERRHARSERGAQRTRYGERLGVIYLSHAAPSPIASVSRSSLAWRFPLFAWKTRKNNACSAGNRASRRV